MLELRRKVLKENDMLARRLRDRFQSAGTRVISLVSSPGSGKTTLLERVLTDLPRQYRVAALVGDLATENDAARLARSGAAVKQITTGTICHLDASMIERALSDWPLEELGLSFHRKRREPGLPIQLRFGRRPALGIGLDHRRGRQAAEISNDI
jgi:hydrogenase nickel incorporation protein HypB